MGVRAEQVERSGAVVRLALSDELRSRPRSFSSPPAGAQEPMTWASRRSVSSTGERSRSTRPFRALSESWLDAIGDVNGIAALTHMGKYQAHVASQAILGRPANTEPAPVTRVVFT